MISISENIPVRDPTSGKTTDGGVELTENGQKVLKIFENHVHQVDEAFEEHQKRTSRPDINQQLV